MAFCSNSCAATSHKLLQYFRVVPTVHGTKTDGPMNLTVQNDTHDGERSPHLKRIDGTPDYVDEITKRLTPAPPAEKEKTNSGQ
jgi:hypothetical protein